MNRAGNGLNPYVQRRSQWNVEQLVTVDQNKRGQTESASQKPEIISTTYKAL